MTLYEGSMYLAKDGLNLLCQDWQSFEIDICIVVGKSRGL
jgi:hypothetical protein